MSECGNPHVSLAVLSEAGTRRRDDVRFSKKFAKKWPGRAPGGTGEPDVRRAGPAEEREARICEPFADDARILHIVVDLFMRLPIAFGRERGKPAFLRDVGRAVEHRRLASVPVLIEYSFRGVLRDERFGDDAPPQGGAGGARRFRKKLYFYR